jgi:hypothetical protein
MTTIKSITWTRNGDRWEHRFETAESVYINGELASGFGSDRGRQMAIEDYNAGLPAVNSCLAATIAARDARIAELVGLLHEVDGWADTIESPMPTAMYVKIRAAIADGGKR